MGFVAMNISGKILFSQDMVLYHEILIFLKLKYSTDD